MRRVRAILLTTILCVVGQFSLAGTAVNSFEGPASLYDVESIKEMTLADLQYVETARYTIGNKVIVLIGTWSSGEWDTFDKAGNPRTITLRQRFALYVPTGTPRAADVGMIKATRTADDVFSEHIVEVVSHLGIPVLAHGEYKSNWRSLGYSIQNQMLAFSLKHITMLNPVYPQDFITGNYFWVLPYADMCAVTLLQRLAEQAGWEVERVGLMGGSNQGFACWIATAVDDRIEVASPGGYQFEDFVHGFQCYGTDWNWKDQGPLGPIMEGFRSFYNWTTSTPAGEALQECFSAERFKDCLYPRFLCLRGDVTLPGMHDADYYPLGSESPFLESFTQVNWRYNRKPNERESNDFRQKSLLYITGEALFRSDDEINQSYPKVIGVEVNATEDRSFQVQAYVSDNSDSVRLWWSHSETRRWNDHGQAPWVSVPMEKQPDGSFLSEWQHAPRRDEIAYYVEAESWFLEAPYPLPCRDASFVQFLWRLPPYTDQVETNGEDPGSGEGEGTLPNAYLLSQNYPNPFNLSTVIDYDLPVSSHVRLEVYNIFGQKLGTLVDGRQRAGYMSVVWDASELSSGVYFYKLTAGDFSEIKRMTLLR
jgi:hypothetical protein